MQKRRRSMNDTIILISANSPPPTPQHVADFMIPLFVCAYKSVLARRLLHYISLVTYFQFSVSPLNFAYGQSIRTNISKSMHTSIRLLYVQFPIHIILTNTSEILSWSYFPCIKLFYAVTYAGPPIPLSCSISRFTSWCF